MFVLLGCLSFYPHYNPVCSSALHLCTNCEEHIFQWLMPSFPVVSVRFENIVVKGDESAGMLIFALVTSEPAAESFTVQVCMRDLNSSLATDPESDGFATGKCYLYTCMYTHTTNSSQHTHTHTHTHTNTHKAHTHTHA